MLARTETAVIDAVLATALLAAALVSMAGGIDAPPSPRHAGALALLLLLAGIAPLYLRRRMPFVVLVAVSVPIIAMMALEITPGVLGPGLFLAAYTVGAWSSRKAMVAAAVYSAAMLLSMHLLWPDRLTYPQLVENAVLFATSFALGETARARRAAAKMADARAELLVQHQAERARQQATEQRLRLARELHDVVAHSLGVIAVQAGVGAHVMDTEPIEARRALEAIAMTSRESLREVRGMLGVLRSDNEVDYAPQSGLHDLDALVERTRRAGVVVELTMDGTPTLPEGLDRTAYAVVQEALTNVIRHAPGSHAAVRVISRADSVILEVVDDGGSTSVNPGSGIGLASLRDRVRVWGGQVSSGPLPEGGFAVRAELPRAMVQ